MSSLFYNPLIKKMIPHPADWASQQNREQINVDDEIYTSCHAKAEVVVGGLESNQIQKCKAIVRAILDHPHQATNNCFSQYFQALYSIKLDDSGLEKSHISTINALTSLPLPDKGYQQLEDRQQLTIKIMYYIDRTFTKFIDYQLDHLKPLVRDGFAIQQNTPDAIRLFSEIESLARIIYTYPKLKQLRSHFRMDFCHFDEILNNFGLFGDEGSSLLDMAMTKTKRVIGIDFQPKTIDFSAYYSTFEQRVAFVSKEYPSKALSWLLFEAFKCGNTKVFTEVTNKIEEMDPDCAQVSRCVNSLQDDAFVYNPLLQRSGSLQMMQQKTRALLALKSKVKEMNLLRLRCCVLNLAATMQLQTHETVEALQATIHTSQQESLKQVLKMIPYCNENHTQEVIRQIAKAILTARKYQPRFLTYRFVTERVQFRLKIAKIVALKERMYSRSEGNISASSSQTVSDQQDLQFVLNLDNFSNQVNFRLKGEDQQFFLNIVEKTIFHLCINQQDAETWKKSLFELYHDQLRCQTSRPSRGQLDRYFHNIKLMLFSNYCQKTMKHYLNHQQMQRIFNQDIPDPQQILRELKSATPHYLGEWT